MIKIELDRNALRYSIKTEPYKTEDEPKIPEYLYMNLRQAIQEIEQDWELNTVAQFYEHVTKNNNAISRQAGGHTFILGFSFQSVGSGDLCKVFSVLYDKTQDYLVHDPSAYNGQLNEVLGDIEPDEQFVL